MPLQPPRFPLLTPADWDRWARFVAVEPDPDSVGEMELQNSGVTSQKIANGAVVEEKIATQAVTTVKIKPKAVTNSKLADGPALTVVCNPTNAEAERSDLAAGSNDQILIRRADALVFATLLESDIPADIARDTEVTAAIAAHVAAADPHPQYTTAAELAAATAALNIASGTYTPTLTNVANLDASTAFLCQYLRVGATVTVSGKVSVDPTAAVSTQLGISLPIPSNFGAEEDCAGTAFAPGIAGQGAAILGDAANNRAQMTWVAVDLTNQPMFFQFTYRII